MPSREPPSAMGQHWSDGETTALVDAWVPLHLRRSRDSPSSRAKYRNHLTSEDWRVVAAAVNAHRGASSASGHRTTAQCERRVKVLIYQPTSCLSRRLRASLDGPPTDLGPAKIPPSVQKEKGNDDEEEEEEEEEMDDDDVGSSGGTIGEPAVARKPTNGGWSVAAAVVTKLAEVYERVEMAALDVEKQRIKMESEKHRKNSCSCKLTLTEAGGHRI